MLYEVPYDPNDTLREIWTDGSFMGEPSTGEGVVNLVLKHFQN